MLKPARLLSLLVLYSLTFSAGFVYALPSGHFTLENGDWYDDWGINRNYYGGPDGYLQNLASETIGPNRELAYSIGASLRNMYGDGYETAVQILKYVQTWTVYGYDSENVYINGEAQDEWAWNADETAHVINETTGVGAIGDCEDMAFLCATLYSGAGFDSAIVDAPGHCACLIWLPEYPNADIYWDIPDDSRGAGWIWVEATGKNNPLGWTPPDFENGDWTAYPVGTLEPVPEPTPGPVPEQTSTLQTVLLIIGIVTAAYLITVVAVRIQEKRSHSRSLQYHLQPRQLLPPTSVPTHQIPPPPQSIDATPLETSPESALQKNAQFPSSKAEVVRQVTLVATKKPRYCSSCGISLGEKADRIKFCPNCGEKTQAA